MSCLFWFQKRRATAAVFSPLDISDLKLWLDADDASSVVLNGSNVSQWNDKSGNGHHFIQATATNQPDYTRTINGRKVIDFDGVDNYLRNTSFTTSDRGHVYIVVKQDSDPGEDVPRFFDGNPRWSIYYDGRAVYDEYRMATSAGIIGYPETPANLDLNLYLGKFNGSSSRLYRNGISLVYGNVAYVGSSNWVLGANANQISNFLDGAIGEVMYYNRILTDSEDNRIKNYISGKWGITVS